MQMAVDWLLSDCAEFTANAYGVWPSQVTLSPSLRYFKIKRTCSGWHTERFECKRVTGLLTRGLSDLPHLWFFHVRGANFTGAIPALPKSIKFFIANGNALSGTTPDLVNYPRVETFDISHNLLNGLGKINSCPRLQQALANGNKIKGFPSLLDLPSLDSLNLAENIIEGTLPASLSELTAVQTLDLHSNALISPLPSAGASLTLLTHLDISQNQFTDDCGKLFSIFLQSGATTPLVALIFSDNQITGTCPGYFELLPNLRTFNAANNNLSGKLPEFWSENIARRYSQAHGTTFNSQLVEIDVSGNRFGHSIPESLAGARRLLSFTANGNPLLLGTEFEWIDLDNCTSPLPSCKALPDWNGDTARCCSLVAPPRKCCRALPKFVVQSSFLLHRKEFEKRENEEENARRENYACPELEIKSVFSVGPPALGTVTLSPEYYAWNNCKCNEGFMGVPPFCIEQNCGKDGGGEFYDDYSASCQPCFPGMLICAHASTPTCALTHVGQCAQMQIVHECARACKHMHVCMRVYTHLSIQTSMSAYKHAAFKLTRRNVCIDAWKQNGYECTHSACISTCMRACMHTSTHGCIHISTLNSHMHPCKHSLLNFSYFTKCVLFSYATRFPRIQ